MTPRDSEINDLHSDLEAIQEIAGVGHWEADLNNGRTRWSAKIPKLLNQAPENMPPGMEFLKMWAHPKDLPLLEEAEKSLFANGSASLVYRAICPGDELKILHARMYLLPGNGGERNTVRGTLQDITELRTAENNLRLLQTGGNLGYWSYRPATGKISWSTPVYEIYGLPPGEAIDFEKYISRIHPADRGDLSGRLRDALENQRDYTVEHRVNRDDGTIVWVRAHGEVVSDGRGNVLLLQGTVRDITREKRAELDLKNLLEAVDNSALVSVTDRKGVIVKANDRFCDVSGYTEEELLGHDHRIINSGHHPTEFWRGMWRDISQGRTWRAEVRNKAKDGSTYWVDTVINPIRDSEGRVYRYLSIRNLITDKKNQQAELARARDKAEKSNQAKSLFLSSMSHELRTPLNALLGFTQLLELNPNNNLLPDDLDSIREISRAGKHLLELITDVLDLSAIESGKIRLKTGPVEIYPLLAEVTNTLRALAARRKIDLVLAPASEFRGLKVFADRSRLRQILLNLVSNGIKYNNPGGRVELFPQESENPEYLRLAVRDNGFGISPSRQEQLFESFQRLGMENSDIPGTGIGLVITRELARMMNGRLHFESRLAAGSTFWVDLPRAFDSIKKPGFRPVSGNIPLPPTGTSTPGPARVLYIENNPANLRLVERFFTRYPRLDLFTASEPARGLEIAFTNPVDLFLLDLGLDGDSGFEILRRLRGERVYRQAPIIALSADAMEKDVERGLRAGFNDYLTKPVNLRRLDQVLRAFLSG